MPNKHAFQAVGLLPEDRELVLMTFPVRRGRTADQAYALAEEVCEHWRAKPHAPAAFVREINAPMTQTYLVTWTIDIEAETPRAAAEAALAIQRDSSSIATVFVVSTSANTAETIDLSGDPDA